MMSLRLAGEGSAGNCREPCEAIRKSLATCFARGRLHAASGPAGGDAAVLSCPRRAGADANRGIGPEVIVWREAGHIIRQASAPASANDFEVACTVRHRIDHQLACEGGQGTLLQAREREQVRVGHLVGREDAARVDVLPIEQAQVVRPKDVDRMRAQISDEWRDRGRRLHCVRVARIADDVHDAVFGQRAGCPRRVADPTEPFVCSLVL